MVNSKDGFVANDGYLPPVGSTHTSAVAVEIAKRIRRRRAKRTRISPTERPAREEDRINLRKSFGSRPEIYHVRIALRGNSSRKVRGRVVGPRTYITLGFGPR